MFWRTVHEKYEVSEEKNDRGAIDLTFLPYFGGGYREHVKVFFRGKCVLMKSPGDAIDLHIY